MRASIDSSLLSACIVPSTFGSCIFVVPVLASAEVPVLKIAVVVMVVVVSGTLEWGNWDGGAVVS
jgi:hypothetical protein